MAALSGAGDKLGGHGCILPSDPRPTHAQGHAVAPPRTPAPQKLFCFWCVPDAHHARYSVHLCECRILHRLSGARRPKRGRLFAGVPLRAFRNVGAAPTGGGSILARRSAFALAPLPAKNTPPFFLLLGRPSSRSPGPGSFESAFRVSRAAGCSHLAALHSTAPTRPPSPVRPPPCAPCAAPMLRSPAARPPRLPQRRPSPPERCSLGRSGQKLKTSDTMRRPRNTARLDHAGDWGARIPFPPSSHSQPEGVALRSSLKLRRLQHGGGLMLEISSVGPAVKHRELQIWRRISVGGSVLVQPDHPSRFAHIPGRPRQWSPMPKAHDSRNSMQDLPK